MYLICIFAMDLPQSRALGRRDRAGAR